MSEPESIILRAARLYLSCSLPPDNETENAWMKTIESPTEMARAYIAVCEENKRLRWERDRLIAETVYSTTEKDGKPIMFSWRIGRHNGFRETYEDVVKIVRQLLYLNDCKIK